MRITGYPIVFGVWSVDLGGFIEVIAPSAVDRTLRQSADVVALVNHNDDKPLGRISAGTLALRKDAHGLAIDLDADEGITFGHDVIQVIRRGDAVGGSFSFRTMDDIWTMTDGTPHREVIDMAIREVSLGVSFPAYPQTTLSASQRHAPARPRGRSVALAERQLRVLMAR